MSVERQETVPFNMILVIFCVERQTNRRQGQPSQCQLLQNRWKKAILTTYQNGGDTASCRSTPKTSKNALDGTAAAQLDGAQLDGMAGWHGCGGAAEQRNRVGLRWRGRVSSISRRKFVGLIPGCPCRDVAVKQTAELFVGNVRAGMTRAQRVRNRRTSRPAKRI